MDIETHWNLVRVLFRASDHRASDHLSDAQDKPEKQDSGEDEKPIHQPVMAHPPASQGELDADQNMDQEEEDQIKVKPGMHMFGLIHGDQYFFVPCVS